MSVSPTFGSWRKSPWSRGGDNCVEVAISPDGQVGVRHSKHPEQPPLIFNHSEWTAFLQGAQDGYFNPADEHQPPC
ncbi:MAG: DUF397 domain-containing protein [Pseudonocardia sp.]|nr:DUF397 domain-containing protein [Pseudonocardia sp.]